MSKCFPSGFWNISPNAFNVHIDETLYVCTIVHCVLAHWRETSGLLHFLKYVLYWWVELANVSKPWMFANCMESKSMSMGIVSPEQTFSQCGALQKFTWNTICEFIVHVFVYKIVKCVAYVVCAGCCGAEARDTKQMLVIPYNVESFIIYGSANCERMTIYVLYVEWIEFGMCTKLEMRILTR